MMCQTLFDAVEAVEAKDPRPATRILLTPQGQKYDQAMAESLAKKERLLLIAGHYEGFDERIIDGLKPIELSLGDYVLSGGELAAMVIVDSIVRLLPGAIGHEQGAADETFADVLLEFPQYTRPREYRGMTVPDVLLSGNHQAIAAWRMEQRKLRTEQRRPDLWAAWLQRNPPQPERKKKRKTESSKTDATGDTSHAQQDPRPG
jgi:tRNA (guanine37-N1)-methyltransferase